MAEKPSPNRTIKIGGASGYWGDSVMATPQLLAEGNLDYIVYDFLAEITMSIMARAKAKDPGAGYAKDFIAQVLAPNLSEISKSGTKIIANAGGVNPRDCGEAVKKLVSDSGLNLSVAIITGDDLLDQFDTIAAKNPIEMFSGEPFPSKDKIASINAYLGAFPIAAALAEGADIVVTGRCVDSAVTLAPCIHEFGWTHEQYDLLASGSLAGHIIECGVQATGGNFTDWESVGDIANLGYPIAEISQDGSFHVSKPDGTGGVVNIGTISEQMLYEIADPRSYFLPDVICDFSDVMISEVEPDRVFVSSAKGRAPASNYKVCATFADGHRTGTALTFYGEDADKRATVFANAAIERTKRILTLLNARPLREVSTEIIGAESQFGGNNTKNFSEVVLKIAAKHETPLEGNVLLREIAGLGLAAPPGLSGFQGARAKPSPIMRLFSFLSPKEIATISIEVDGSSIEFSQNNDHSSEPENRFDPPETQMPEPFTNCVDVPLVKLAWARSGDKGNQANVGVIARKPEFFPYIWQALSERKIAKAFSHFLDDASSIESVERFFLPGISAMNIVLKDVLGGGGVASLRNDPQGKGYAQLLLTLPIAIPEELVSSIK